MAKHDEEPTCGGVGDRTAAAQGALNAVVRGFGIFATSVDAVVQRRLVALVLGGLPQALDPVLPGGFFGVGLHPVHVAAGQLDGMHLVLLPEQAAPLARPTQFGVLGRGDARLHAVFDVGVF